MKKTDKKQSALPAIPLLGEREKRLNDRQLSLCGLSRENDRYAIKNLLPTPAGLASSKQLSSPSGAGALTDVRGIYPFEDQLLVLNMEDSHIAFYVYDGTQLRKSFVTAASYPYDFKGSDLIASLAATCDTSPHIEEETPGAKLLYFPANRFAFLEGGAPGPMRALPPEVPDLDMATVAGGRLYGVKGQEIFVSGGGGCFDWQYDSAGSAPDPIHAWRAKTTTAADKQMPVTALRGYRDCVLVFRENAVQKITGSCNPFAVKDLFRVGTSFPASIRELEGDLYFVSQNEVYRFNGSSLKQLEKPDPSALLTGSACVIDGRYCFAALLGGERFLYCYDPHSGQFGHTALHEEPRDFASISQGDYAFVISGGAGRLRRFADDKSGAPFEAVIPLLRKQYGETELENLFLRYRCRQAGGALSVSLKVYDEKGLSTTTRLASLTGQSGRRTFRKRTRIRIPGFADLAVSGTGDFLIEGVEAHFRSLKGRNTKY